MHRASFNIFGDSIKAYKNRHSEAISAMYHEACKRYADEIYMAKPVEFQGRSQPIDSWAREWNCEVSTAYRKIRAARPSGLLNGLVRLQSWATKVFGEPQHPKNLTRWTREGVIQPSPILVGKRYYVDPSARFFGSRKRGRKSYPVPCAFDALSVSMPDEVWRPVPGWEQFYRVSNLGRVYSLHQTGRMVGCGLNDAGYYTVELRDHGVSGHALVHRLVLTAFVGPPPDDYHGCHCNGVSTDNRISNLRWDTALSNIADKVLHGTNKPESTTKLTAELVRTIRTSPAISASEWVRRTGATRKTIFDARLGRTWKHLDTPPLRKRA
jgi:hypothetical protein